LKAEHPLKFWTPAMRKQLRAYPRDGAEGLLQVVAGTIEIGE
jgi:hypothetical protein